MQLQAARETCHLVMLQTQLQAAREMCHLLYKKHNYSQQDKYITLLYDYRQQEKF